MRDGRLMSVRAQALLAVVALVHLTCQSILNAPSDSTLVLIVNPQDIEANGGVAVVSALVTESIGTPVADGTVVQFFTNLGQIDEQGKTNDGVARVNFVSDSRSGTATIRAFSGSVTGDPVEVRIGGARVVRVSVAAVPQRLTDSRTSQITATVFDQNGNPVPNIGVIFTVTGESTEFMESNGLPQFTDRDGRARDVFRTRYPFGAPPREVTVNASTTASPGTGGASPTPGSTGGSVVIFIN
jgi:Big-like domain-containing protein